MKTMKVNNLEDIPKNYTGIVEFSNGTKEWHLNGQLHRTDGPAIEYPDGTKAWYLNGKQHREDGPAVEFSNGEKQWHLNDKWLDENKIKQLLNLGYPIKTAIKLAYWLEINKS